MARIIDYKSATSSSKQKKFTTGYLDAKMQPVPEFDDLNDIPRSERFIGLSVTVLNGENGEPTEYWLKNGITNTDWEKKTCSSQLDKVGGNDTEE